MCKDQMENLQIIDDFVISMVMDTYFILPLQ